MQSLAYVAASNGAANPSLMTVQNVRSPGASSIIVNTVAGAPAKFYGTMGTPHTFVDPVTGETITVISDATAVDFAGSLLSGHVEIDAIAPGYTDLGSKVGDIIIIRPITEWGNNLYNILNQSLNTDGTIKNSAITYNPNVFDHVQSGAAMFALGGGSLLTASLGAGVAYINGSVQTITVVPTRTYTANKDTYVDALYNASGVATIVYTEVANNATSPVLAANSIRLAIVVTGATFITDNNSINQGQENRILPIVSSVPYTVTDSLGNLICPRDPTRRRLGYRQIISNFASATPVDITGLNLVFNNTTGGQVKVSGYIGNATATTANNAVTMTLIDVTNASAVLAVSSGTTNASADSASCVPSRIYTPSANVTNVKAQIGHGANASTSNTNSSAVNPAYIVVERY